MLARKNLGFQPSSPTLRIACADPFGAAQEKKISAPEIVQGDDLGIDGGVAHFIGFVGDDHAGLGAETVLQALELILAGVVVLPEHRDLAVRENDRRIYFA